MTNKVLCDYRDVPISCGDTVAVPWFDYDTNTPRFEIATVEGMNYTTNEIYLYDGEPIPLDKFDVIVLPDEYSEDVV